MPRPLTNWNKTRIHADVVYRRHLLEIAFLEGTLRYCSGDSIQYAGYTWHTTGLEFATDMYSYMAVTITDRTHYFRDLILSSYDETLVPVSLHLLMGKETEIPENVHDTIFTGKLSNVKVIGDKATFRAEVDTTKLFPSLVAGKVAGMQHLPASPLIVQYGDREYKIN